MCGSAPTLACPACGSAYRSGDLFCAECGARLKEAAETAAVPTAPAAAPVAGRRLVTVLFADLVGFTSLSETQDSEEKRELLSRYFDSCRRLTAAVSGRTCVTAVRLKAARAHDLSKD